MKDFSILRYKHKCEPFQNLHIQMPFHPVPGWFALFSGELETKDKFLPRVTAQLQREPFETDEKDNCDSNQAVFFLIVMHALVPNC